MASHELTDAFSSIELEDKTHKTGVGDFEMVDEFDTMPSQDDVMKEATSTLKIANKIINTGPIISELQNIINQTKIIITYIPKDVNETPYEDLPKTIKLSSELKEEIGVQQNNIKQMLGLCDKPMKKRSLIHTAFNPEEYKEAIKICQAFTPLLEKYQGVLSKMAMGDMRFLRNFYMIRNQMEIIGDTLKKSGGKKTKRKRVKKSKCTRKRSTSRRKRSTSRRKRSKGTRKRNKSGGLGLEASERTKQIMQVTNVFKQDLNRKNITQEYYDCLIQNKVIQQFVDMNIRRGLNSTPTELAKIIITDNTECDS